MEEGWRHDHERGGARIGRGVAHTDGIVEHGVRAVDDQRSGTFGGDGLNEFDTLDSGIVEILASRAE